MLRVRGLTVGYEGADHPAVDGLDLDVGPGEIVAVLGPSGCGKSTLLRAVAGLVPVEQGTIELAGRDLAGVPTHERGIGLMFQDYALFPHRDVGDNVAFGLRMRGMARRDRDERVGELLDLVGLPGAERQSVAALSGGERQRVALARALAPTPGLLMLDEPLSALDRALRDRLVVELGELFAVLGPAVLYVTHDQGEALGLAHRVVVMDGGHVVQEGTPVELWGAPASEFVARFLGFTNLFEQEDGTTLLLRPEGVVLTGVDEPDATPARVLGVRFAGSTSEVRLDVEGLGLVTAVATRSRPPAIGTRCGVRIDPGSIQVIRS
jgi:thiamine transport system ATP-binding protein